MNLEKKFWMKNKKMLKIILNFPLNQEQKIFSQIKWQLKFSMINKFKHKSKILY